MNQAFSLVAYQVLITGSIHISDCTYPFAENQRGGGVRVFGSMSRGDGGDDSDVDLLVTLAPGTSALALGGLLLDAQDLLGRRVDVVTEAGLHPALRERVMADAVPL